MLVSVVIATLDEETAIGHTITCARRNYSEAEVDIIVCDSGSTDAAISQLTPSMTVIHSPRGRGTQMNYGAAASHGEIPVFCHADSQLPGARGASPDAPQRVERLSTCRIGGVGRGYRPILSFEPGGDGVKRHLIVFARYPLPGHTKTRLASTLGERSAAGIYARLLYTYLLDLIQANRSAFSIELSLSSPEEVAYFGDAFPEFMVTHQEPGDIGARMSAAFNDAFARAATQVVLTGSDIPGIGREAVRDAFALLEENPVVLAPAADGGYTLIGMQAPGAPLFDNIEWSTSRVLEQTVTLAERQRVAVKYLPTTYDIDTVEDFVRWKQHLAADADARRR